MIGRRVAWAVGLQDDQLARALPFFGLYLLLFAALTMADAVAVALFASRVGAAALPRWYSVTALVSLICIGLYLTQATRRPSSTLFGWILLPIASLWLLAWYAQQWTSNVVPVGMLFVTREIALTMVLMHFGTFLQDYFLRTELNRILPIIYAGGRVGGILAGAAVNALANRWGTANLVLIPVGLLLLACGGVLRISRKMERREEPDEHPLKATAATFRSSNLGRLTPLQSTWAFLQQFRSTPLLTWLTFTTLSFVLCRWFLAYQYTSSFEVLFTNEAELASFLGRYTQVALGVSLILQLFVVNRLVSRLGVAATHLSYSLAVMGSLLGNVFGAGLGLAVISRFVEAELRFGLRNPVNQMMVNRFAKSMRIVVRGWSLGWLIPIGTLLASAALSGLSAVGGRSAVAMAGAGLGVAYLLSSFRVGHAFNQHETKPVSRQLAGE